MSNSNETMTRAPQWDRRAFLVASGAAASAIAFGDALLRPNAAGAVSAFDLDIACGTPAAQPVWHRYHTGSIRIRDMAFGGPLDHARLAAIGVATERCFIRFATDPPAGQTVGADLWVVGTPTPGNITLDTDPQPNFTLGDAWLADQNSRGIELVTTQEGLTDTSWFPADKANDPVQADYDLYEEVLVEIYTHIKNKELDGSGPVFSIAGSLNEPSIGKNGPNGGWPEAVQYQLFKANIKAINTVNANLGLTGSGRLLAKGPCVIEAPISNGNFEAWIDSAVADAVFWDASVKPILAYWSIHNFNDNQNNPNTLVKLFEAIDTYIASTTKPDLIDGIPRAPSAYSYGLLGGNDNEPSASDMAKTAAYYSHIWRFLQDYTGPQGERMEFAINFCQSNYRHYENSIVRPYETSGVNIPWAGTDGVQTPVSNAWEMASKVAPGVTTASRLSVTEAGPDSWPVLGPTSGRGFTGDAVTASDTPKVWALISGLRFGSSAGHETRVAFNNIGAAGLDSTQDFTVRRWTVDKIHSNVGTSAGEANAPLALVETVTVAANTNPVYVFSADMPSAHLVEIEGTASGGNGAPVITPVADQSTVEGEAVSVQVVATDPDVGDTLSYGATNLPDGLSIDSLTGLISGTVTVGAVAQSPYATLVTVGDGTATVSDDVVWTITVGSGGSPFKDTFTDTGGVLLENHTPNNDTVGGGWPSTTGSFQIDSDGIGLVQTSTTGHVTRLVDAGTNEVVNFSMTMGRGSSGSRWNGIAVLGVANNVNTALNVRGHGGAGAADLRLYDGTANVLDTWTVGFTEGDKLDGSIEFNSATHVITCKVGVNGATPVQVGNYTLTAAQATDHAGGTWMGPYDNERVAPGNSIWHSLEATTG